MAAKLSTGLVEYLAGTGSLRDAFNGDAKLSIYAGTPPAGADLASSGHTLLCEILADGTDPLEFESDVANGVVTKLAAQTWSGTNLASGTATWFRLELSADDKSEDSTAIRLQGNIGTLSGEMIMTNPALTMGNVKQIENFRMAIPAA